MRVKILVGPSPSGKTEYARATVNALSTQENFWAIQGNRRTALESANYGVNVILDADPQLTEQEVDAFMRVLHQNGHSVEIKRFQQRKAADNGAQD